MRSRAGSRRAAPRSSSPAGAPSRWPRWRRSSAGARSRPTSSSRTRPARLLAEAGDVDVLVANAALPASGELDELHAGGDRPRARGQPARADPARAAADRAAGGAPRRAPRVRRLAVGQVGRPALVALLGDEVRAPRLRARAAAGPRRARRRGVAREPRIRARRGHVRRLRRAAPARRRDQHAGGRRRRRRARDRGATAARSTWRRSRCAPARASPGSHPGLTAGVQAKLGSFQVARDIGAGQRDKR